ncbi:MAG TPA: amino acid ABC transporter substrate-binding protein [Anaeromyxobacteraceae bacterium]|nr:amino acid ABC transporter substrate-binding protein [Anaeromyxobacteraceae bacterium]
MLSRNPAVFLALAVSASFPTAARAGKTLDAVKARDQVVCGINPSAPGFASTDGQGRWVGLDVDLCRAIAAAVLGDAGKVRFVPLDAQERFAALQAGEVDVLCRNTTFSLARDVSLGIVFTGGINYYDGQGFMVPKKLNAPRSVRPVESVRHLEGATICVQSGTSSEKNVAEYFAAHKIRHKLMVLDTAEAARSALFGGRCQAYTTDMSNLAGARTQASNPGDWVVLSEVISKEPLGPAVRRGDDEWFSLVRWCFYATVRAEELGITQANVDKLKAESKDPLIQRFVGTGEDTGKLLGLDSEWTYRIVKQVGNYGESFDRNLGPKSPLGLPRGANNLWTQGGLQYAPPLR